MENKISPKTGPTIAKNNDNLKKKVIPKTNSSKKSEYDLYKELEKSKKQNFKKILKDKKVKDKKEFIASEAQIKIEKAKDPERKNRVKRLFFGVGKEFWRVTWPKKGEMFNSFITVIIILLVLASILTGITFLITTYIN